ncbi:MAG TPA: FtsX-like permease family protein [Candidatus Aminicenantes bacterium]|nr:FtsX-like permease family protein [Candidatus Aminicenantes bacterium]
MLKNYLKTALRNLKKHAGTSLINVAGLAVGMACCILIMLFVFDELGFDRFNENYDHIWRVTRKWYNADGEVNLHLGHVAPPVGPLLKNDFPEILQAVRLIDVDGLLVNSGPLSYEENRFYFAEESLFDVFTFKMVAGDPATALAEPFAVVVTTDMARKYFGPDDPLGRSLTIQASGRGGDLKVTGVVEPLPAGSHFHPDFLGSFKTFEAIVGPDEMQSWSSNNYATYLLLPDGYDVGRLAGRLDDFIDRRMAPGMSAQTKLELQPLRDIHLRSHLDSEIEANGDIKYVRIFSIIAFFVLLVACANFMNLATARSAGRAREVGLRKVVGARKAQLVLQFLGESVLTAVISLGVALGLVLLALPAFNRFLGRGLALKLGGNGSLILFLAAIAVFVGIVSGLYPALFLSGFRPARVLKGAAAKGGTGLFFRKALVVFQFTISIVLIICVGVVSEQLAFMRAKDLGFDKERVVILPSSPEMIRDLESFKARLLRDPGVLSVSAAKRVPSGRLLDSAQARLLTGEERRSIDFRIANLLVDHDYIPTFGITVVAGRNFSKERGTDATQAFVINEAAARRIGWSRPEEAIGQGFEYGRRRGQIIGVVKDFHFESLHQEISPIVMYVSASDLGRISIRLAPGDIPRTMEFLRATWAEMRPNRPFSYSFIDENFDRLYRSEEDLGRIFRTFAWLSVGIGCLGLFGLASFSAERRTKEIGIRKVLGASTGGLAVLLSKEFTRWALVANLVAWPVAYFAMSRWLRNFAYRMDIGPGVFLMAGALALAVAILTVSSQAVKAALSDPVRSLRYE